MGICHGICHTNIYQLMPFGCAWKYEKLWNISSIPTWMWWGYVKNMKFSQSKWGIWRSPQTGRMWAEFSHIDVNYEKERIFVQRMNLHEWTSSYLCSAWICMNEHHPIHVVVFGSTIVTWLEFRSLNLNFETGDLIDLANINELFPPAAARYGLKTMAVRVDRFSPGHRQSSPPLSLGPTVSGNGNPTTYKKGDLRDRLLLFYPH